MPSEPPSSYISPTTRRRGSIFTKQRPVTAGGTPTQPETTTPNRSSYRMSYHGSSQTESLDWLASASNTKDQNEAVTDEPLSNTMSFEPIEVSSTHTAHKHSRRPSSLADSFRSSLTNMRTLSRRVSLSIRGKNKGRDDTADTPGRRLSTRVSNPNLLSVPDTPSARPRSRDLSSFFNQLSDGTPSRPKSRGLLSLHGRRKASMPILTSNVLEEFPRPEPESDTSSRDLYDRRIALLPDYVHGGAGARASAAAQNEALQLARSTPLPPYEPMSSSHGELRDSESGIGIMVEDFSRQDSRSPHVKKCDPADVLATELLEHLLSFLDAPSLVHLELVSKRWRELCQSQLVWRRIFYREYAPNGSQRLIGLPGIPGLGKNTVNQDFRKLYSVRKLIERRWQNGEAAAIYLNGHKDSVYCIQFDEEKIITGSRDNTIRVWDARTYQCIKKLAPPNNPRERNEIRRPDVEPHGLTPFFKMDASSVEPKSPDLHLWHQASVLCLQYDDEILVTGSSDFKCIVWSIKNDYQPLFRLDGHTAGVLDVCIDSKRIITCSKDTTIRVWDRATGKLLKVLSGHRGPVNAVQVRGNLLASASGDGMSKLWSLESGQCIKEFHSKERGLACVEFSEDGRTIFAGGNDHVIFEFDTTNGNVRRELKGHTDLVRSLHLDSANGRIISGSYDHSIKVWDAHKGKDHEDDGMKINLKGWTSSWMLAAKSNYRKIACASQDGRVVIVDFGFGINGVELVEA